jgi:hypothetical protein
MSEAEAMRRLACWLTLALVLMLAAAAWANELREIELTDGSVLSGEILSLNNGVFTIRTRTLGVITIAESKVRTIREQPVAGEAAAGPGSGGLSAQARAMQGKMMSDQEIMGLILSLQDDPEFQKILADPEVMGAVSAGDITALTANPRFMQLMNNPTVKKIQRKVR